ncbi:hypothetical protein PoB_006420800 [Plakobranchus ocellatus]|uniref:DUF4291 domain-containing protein n=1 Tax=Plakobranchus ocellatus TaxID=259542 RepID=A0AAV4D0Y8_9GAST|nr:hypothetical protein PoB_006420800 [Plakobranchus ocellatus]
MASNSFLANDQCDDSVAEGPSAIPENNSSKLHPYVDEEKKCIRDGSSNSKLWHLEKESYVEQCKLWPQHGQHILAHFDDSSVVVYQAFKKSIAKFAVENQKFGGPDYNPDRMSWIKTNFMWMMYRCGWAQKRNQERVLAIRITKEGFEDILSKAYTPWRQKSEGLETREIEVRLQWDPDHDPHGTKLERRAIQLGLKGKILHAFTEAFIVNIEDITDFVTEQYDILQDQGTKKILSPKERIYLPSQDKTCRDIGLDFFSQQKVVAFSS